MPQAMLTLGDTPSFHRRLAVPPPSTPLHILAIRIARDTAASTLQSTRKLPLNNY